MEVLQNFGTMRHSSRASRLMGASWGTAWRRLDMLGCMGNLSAFNTHVMVRSGASSDESCFSMRAQDNRIPIHLEGETLSKAGLCFENTQRCCQLSGSPLQGHAYDTGPK